MIGRHILTWAVSAHLLIACFGTSARAEAPTEKNRALAGLQAVAVQMVELDDAYRKAWTGEGVSESLLEMALEQQLTGAGVRVIPVSQFKESDLYGLLRVRLEILPPEAMAKQGRIRFEDESGSAREPSRYVYQVVMQLRQIVVLKRDPSITTEAPTWQKVSIGFGRLSRVRQVVVQQTEAFIADYRRLNPR